MANCRGCTGSSTLDGCVAKAPLGVGTGHIHRISVEKHLEKEAVCKEMTESDLRDFL